MKLEIKTNEKGYCDYFIMNGKRFGENIKKVTIVIEGGCKPQFIIEGTTELDFKGEDVYIYSDKKMSLLERLKKVFKNCKK